MLELRPIDDVATRTLLRNQASVGEFLEVERQRICGYFQPFRHGPGRQAVLAGHDERTKYLEPDRLGKCRQGSDDYFFFHLSILIEASKTCKPDTRRCGLSTAGEERFPETLSTAQS